MGKKLISIAAALATSACAFAPQLQRVAVDHDQMVARTEDELTLRNILRARYRYPLHFTAVTEVNGDAQISVGASLGATFPGTAATRNFGAGGVPTGSGEADGATSIAPGLSGSVVTRPSFRAAVLETDKFQRGLQRSVNGELIAYYLDAGWRDELLMALFVERLDVVDKQSRRRLASIFNDPDDAYGFQSIVCNFVLRSQRIDDRYQLGRAADVFKPEDLPTLDPSLRVETIRNFVDLVRDERVALDANRLSLRTNSSYSVTFTRGRDRCTGADFSGSKAAWKRAHPGAGLAVGEVRNGIPVLPGTALLDPEQFTLLGGAADTDGGFNARYLGRSPGVPVTDRHDVTLEVHFRSVQDVIYFLGEYLRAGQTAYQIPREYFLTQCGATTARPLRRMRWILKVNEGDADAAVSTRFLGRRMFVPVEAEGDDANRCGTAGGESSRGLQVIALVQQLLNLNKSADQLPTSLSITAIR